jgi:hypothetical protein
VPIDWAWHFSFLFTPFFEDLSAAQPFLLQQVVNNQLVHDFLSQQNNRLFSFSELMDLFVAGRDQSAADQPNNLAEGRSPPIVIIVTIVTNRLGLSSGSQKYM